MELDPDRCYRALSARDRRFDGHFFVGVETTGIDGIRRLYAVRVVEATTSGPNAYAAVGIPVETAEAIVRQTLVRNLTILGVGALLCAAIAALVAERFFLRETRALLKTARGLRAPHVVQLNVELALESVARVPRGLAMPPDDNAPRREVRHRHRL